MASSKDRRPSNEYLVKRCRCGAVHTERDWRALKLVGACEGADGRELELRNCTCGSTISSVRPTGER